MRTKEQTPPSLERLERCADYAGQCSNDLLHEMSQRAFVLQKQLRSYEKAMDKELRRRNKELTALAD